MLHLQSPPPAGLRVRRGGGGGVGHGVGEGDGVVVAARIREGWKNYKDIGTSQYLSYIGTVRFFKVQLPVSLTASLPGI